MNNSFSQNLWRYSYKRVTHHHYLGLVKRTFPSSVNNYYCGLKSLPCVVIISKLMESVTGESKGGLSV